ncbi:MAG: hypothetical protein Q9216_004609 [Gyalolechia sp. 2 TL-2023]
MQYVRSIGGSVSKTWNSINPATLSGAIDVIVVQLEDGSLACSPFHVRFGKFSLLRPSEKKVEFKVNNSKQNYAMKLGDGGEAFFVFETYEQIPESLQTSPVVSPAAIPQDVARDATTVPSLQEPDFLDINANGRGNRGSSQKESLHSRPALDISQRAQSDFTLPSGRFNQAHKKAASDGSITPPSSLRDGHESPPPDTTATTTSALLEGQIKRSVSADLLPLPTQLQGIELNDTFGNHGTSGQTEPQVPSERSASDGAKRSSSPPPLSTIEAVDWARSLSKKLSISNIPSRVTETGDLMLDMTGYKTSEDEALRAEGMARRLLAEELEGNYDIGSLIGADAHGNLWIYSSEETKVAAQQQIRLQSLTPQEIPNDAASDPGYHSDDELIPLGPNKHQRTRSEASPIEVAIKSSQTSSGETPSSGDPNRNYAKTLRLTSEQLKALDLKPGANLMSFSVNRATCSAYMYYWAYDVPIVISDIDGTITKSDALGHVLNMIGRDWTHIGVAKLYTDIVANGYNILYLTSRSVGQADTTRAYLNGVTQEGFKLPKGPVIMSPDRTIAALRREIYLRKPEVFKMACLRDILNLFCQNRNPFYAGFGNRLTDALSYRSVNIPSTRIFTINSNAEVSLDLLTLNKYKNSYVTMRELVDHFFPPVGLLVTGGGEEFTDFNYWRDPPLDLEAFSESDSSDEDINQKSSSQKSIRSEDEGSEGLDDEEQNEILAESYISQASDAESGEMVNSVLANMENNHGATDQAVAKADCDRALPFEVEVEEVIPTPSWNPINKNVFSGHKKKHFIHHKSLIHVSLDQISEERKIDVSPEVITSGFGWGRVVEKLNHHAPRGNSPHSNSFRLKKSFITMTDVDSQSAYQQPATQHETQKSTNPALLPTLSADTGSTKCPRDSRLLHMILANLGVTAYQERVPLQLLDFAYRYTSSTLQDALHLTCEGYGTQAAGTAKAASNNDLSTVTLSSLRLSIASRTHYQFNPTLTKDFYHEIAQERNQVQLPAIGKDWGVRLPPDQYCLTGVGWKMKDKWASITKQDGADDGSDLVMLDRDEDREEDCEEDGAEDGNERMEDIFGENAGANEGNQEMDEG